MDGRVVNRVVDAVTVTIVVKDVGRVVAVRVGTATAAHGFALGPVWSAVTIGVWVERIAVECLAAKRKPVDLNAIAQPVTVGVRAVD